VAHISQTFEEEEMISSSDLISKILSFVPHTGKDWLSIHLVCKKWNEIATRAFDGAAKDNSGLRKACKRGDIEAVKLYLSNPLVDPSLEKNVPIRLACANGHIEIVKILLKDPRVDISDGLALCIATMNNRKDIMELLLQDGRIDPGKWQIRKMDPTSRYMYSFTLLKIFQAGIESRPAENPEDRDSPSVWGQFFSRRIRSSAVV